MKRYTTKALSTISVVIPTLNEEKTIARTVAHLMEIDHPQLLEILVVDGGSADRTESHARGAGARFLESPRPGRACQMNYGAKNAKGDILYFVHSDVLPPHSCFDDILNSLRRGHQAGCFAYHFDSQSKLLKINAFFSARPSCLVGGGDQTLYVLKEIFENEGGFDEEYVIMEDFEFTRRLKSNYGLDIINQKALISARKYEKNSYLRVQLVNLAVFCMFLWGASPQKMKRLYSRRLR